MFSEQPMTGLDKIRCPLGSPSRWVWSVDVLLLIKTRSEPPYKWTVSVSVDVEFLFITKMCLLIYLGCKYGSLHFFTSLLPGTGFPNSRTTWVHGSYSFCCQILVLIFNTRIRNKRERRIYHTLRSHLEHIESCLICRILR